MVIIYLTSSITILLLIIIFILIIFGLLKKVLTFFSLQGLFIFAAFIYSVIDINLTEIEVSTNLSSIILILFLSCFLPFRYMFSFSLYHSFVIICLDIVAIFISTALRTSSTIISFNLLTVFCVACIFTFFYLKLCLSVNIIQILALIILVFSVTSFTNINDELIILKENHNKVHDIFHEAEAFDFQGI